MAPKKALGEPAFLIFLVLGLVYPLSLYATNSMIAAFLNEGLGINLDVDGSPKMVHLPDITAGRIDA